MVIPSRRLSQVWEVNLRNAPRDTTGNPAAAPLAGEVTKIKAGSKRLFKSSWQPKGRAFAEGQLLKRPKGRFAVADIDGQMAHRYANHEVQILSKSTPLADGRCVQVPLLINSKGSSLNDCKSTLELFECIKHTMIGWLIHLLNGSLHGDISIGNVLKTERADGIDVLQFSYPESFENDLKELEKRHATKSGEDAKLWEDMQKAKIEVEKLLKAEFSPASSCTAIVADIDQGRPTDLLYESDEKRWEEPSGTVQFMSHQVLLSIELGSKSFLQSPADDLESFFYVALWAFFFNQHTSKKLSEYEEIFKSKLLSEAREYSVQGYLTTPSSDLSSQLLEEAQPVMKYWERQIFDFSQDIRERARIHKVFAKDAPDSLWRRSVGWILSAYSGVLMIVKLNNHLEILKLGRIPHWQLSLSVVMS